MDAGKETGMSSFSDYSERLQGVLSSMDWAPVEMLAQDLLTCWKDGRQVFICGNGGSAGNAIHIANDFLYGIAKEDGLGLRVHALPANSFVLTCLANDEGYEHIFSKQLAVLAQPNDVVIVLSGSGNSPNILKTLECAKQMSVKSYGILGFSGGKAKAMADQAIHFAIDDMQISEDAQIIVCHMVMQWLYERRGEIKNA